MNLSQKRSKFALDKLDKLSAHGSLKEAGFDSYTAGLPSMVLSNGLAQTFAFILSKVSEKPKGKEVLNWTKEWLEEQGKIKETADHKDFMKEISSMPQSQYLASQKECLLLWEWIKRYSNSNLFN